MELLAIGIIVPWILVGLIAFLTYALVSQASKQATEFVVRLDRLEMAIDRMLDGDPSTPGSAYVGLEPGAPAPSFQIPALTGDARTVSLEDFRGHRLLLLFSRPGCGYCQGMAPGLAALPYDGRDGLPIPVVITTGDEQENRQFVAEHNLRGPVLLQPGTDLYPPYKIQGTPQGYLIDEHGVVTSGVITGAESLLAAFRNPPAIPEKVPPANAGGKNGVGLRITQSHLQRDGLSAGVLAPEFVLPDLNGNPVSLAEFRGRPLLLVFSDSGCGPCQLLSPELEKLHRAAREYQILMVSRGNLAANQAKAAEAGLTFPILLQRHWEISKAYATFKTPAGYLIDADGLVASDIAVGGDAILALARTGAGRAGGQEREVMTRGGA